MDRLTINKKNIVIEILVWGLIGLVLSMSIAAMIISGSHSIKDFYDVGKVYEIPGEFYRSVNIQEKGHQDTSGRIVLDKGEFKQAIFIDGKLREWNYFCIDIPEMNRNTIECYVLFAYYDNEQFICQMQKNCIFKEGLNIVEVSGKAFQYLEIIYRGEEGTELNVKGMQLRDNEPVFTFGEFVGITLLILLIYSLIIVAFRVVWLKKKIKINFYVWIDVLQEIYIKFAEQFLKIKQSFPLLNTYKSTIRTILFLSLFIFNVWIDMYGSYTRRFKYYVIVYLFLIIMIAIISMEKNVEKINWNNPLAWSWIILWGMSCVSDFIITKNYRFSGYAIVLGIGFFYFIWNNMKNPSEMLKDFKHAICIFLIVITVFCLICRPEMEGMRYSGFSNNPSVFGMYLTVCWAVVLSEIEERIKEKNGMIELLPYLLEVGIIFTFIWKSQSACPLICMAFIGTIWGGRVLYYLKKNPDRKYLMAVILLSISVVIVACVGLDLGINHISQKLGTAITLEGEIPIAKKEYGLVVQAADVEETVKNSRLVQKFSSGSLSSILSGRDFYYRGYLRKMNLFGHKSYPVMWGGRRLPHNAIIGIAYQYGVFTSVPYILMLLFVIIRTLRYSFSGKKYAVMPFYVCFSVIIMSMADNVERPFSWLPWFGLYLLMGIVFKENE